MKIEKIISIWSWSALYQNIDVRFQKLTSNHEKSINSIKNGPIDLQFGLFFFPLMGGGSFQMHKQGRHQLWTVPVGHRPYQYTLDMTAQILIIIYNLFYVVLNKIKCNYRLNKHNKMWWRYIFYRKNAHHRLFFLNIILNI